MKKTFYLLFSLFFLASQTIAQEKSLPNVEVKTLQGKTFNIQNLDNDGKPMVISFWATWCKPCKKELNAIAEVYEDWQDETGVKLIAISIDDRNKHKVAPDVNAEGWEYEVYLDPNSDLKRAMNVGAIPHTFLINGNGKIVYESVSYLPGDEEKLYEKIKNIVSK